MERFSVLVITVIGFYLDFLSRYRERSQLVHFAYTESVWVAGDCV